MKPMRVIALLAILLCTLSAVPAAEPFPPPLRDGSAQAGMEKSLTCSACHGSQGNSSIAMFPSLAGQAATYTYTQLQAYRSGTRANAVMRPLAEQLSDQDMKDLAAYYAALPAARPTSVNLLPPDAAAGRTLFTQGDATRGVPPCQGCHGVAGRGPAAATSPALPPHTPWYTYPALAGQQPDYVLAQLQAYQSGTRDRTRNARTMQEVSRSLTDSDMRQLAAYIAQLAPE